MSSEHTQGSEYSRPGGQTRCGGTAPKWRLAATIGALTIATVTALPPHHSAQRRQGPPGMVAGNGMGAMEMNLDGTPRALKIDGGGGQSEKLRRTLLEGYDRGAFPWEYAWEQSGWNATTGTGSRTGLPVEIGINFHRVFNVDVKSSVADLVVWFRQRWTDPRLAWDPEEYDGLTTTWFWISDGIGSGEASEIWTPDIKLWNMESALSDTLTDSYATVDSSGTVFWSRPGHLRPACKFEGLDSFPFDLLSCTMEFGSWSYSGLYLRPIKMGEGFSIGGSDTAGEAFAEYKLDEEDGAIKCREHVYPPYPSLPEEDWPVLFYDVAFHRSWQPYVRGYVLLQVILNFTGFAAFWIPAQAGERVGLAITSLLAAVASELVVAASLPTAAEMTWFQSFSLFSLAFAAFALFESVAVVYFFYYTGKDLCPRWARWLQIRARDGYARIRSSTIKIQSVGEKSKHTSTTESISERRHSNAETWAENGDSSDTSPQVAVEAGGDEDKHAVSDDDSSSNHSCEKGDVFVGLPDDVPRSPRDVTFKDSGSHEEEEPPQDVPPRPTLLRPSILNPSLGAPASWSIASNLRAHDADDFQDSGAAKNNRRWQKVSAGIDEVCRVLLPLTYLIVLTVLLKRVDYL